MNLNQREKLKAGSVALLVVLLIALLALPGCAVNPAALARMAEVERQFWVFESDCRFMLGTLYIPRRRVHNAPPTVWEMTDAVCWFGDGTYPITIEVTP